MATNRRTKTTKAKENKKQVESDFFVEIADGVTLDLYDRGKKGINAKITLLDAFVIFARVIDGEKGAFLSYPSFKTKNGDYVNQAYCFDKEIIKAINEAIETYLDN